MSTPAVQAAQAAHGPGLIGAFLNVFLLGIMVAQCFFYFTTYKKDRLWIKVYVGFLLFADVVNSVLDMYWLYSDLINNFGNVAALNVADWRIMTDPATVAIISTCVQLFFAWRVRVLTHNWWLTALIIFTSFVSCVGGLGVMVYIHFLKTFDKFYEFDQVGTMWLISTAVCDTAIALSLTWHLRRHKTGFQHTDDILNKIIRLTVQNGAITAVWAIVDLILYLSISTGVHLALNLPLVKLYTNSLMSSLNARAGWKFNNETTDRITRSMGAQPAQLKTGPMPEFVELSTRQEVRVHVETHEMVDMADTDADSKWPVETHHSSRDSTHGYKTHNVV